MARTSQGMICLTLMSSGIDGVKALLEKQPTSKATFTKLLESMPDDDNKAGMLEVFNDCFPDATPTCSYDVEEHCTVEDIVAMCPDAWGVNASRVSHMVGLFGLTIQGRMRNKSKGPGSPFYDRATVLDMLDAVETIRAPQPVLQLVAKAA